MEYSPDLSPFFSRHPVTETVLFLSLSAPTAFWPKPNAITTANKLVRITDFISCLPSMNLDSSSFYTPGAIGLPQNPEKGARPDVHQHVRLWLRDHRPPAAQARQILPAFLSPSIRTC